MKALVPIALILAGVASGARADDGWLGLTTELAAEARPGAVEVSDVFPGSPADRALIRKGDVLLRVDGAAIETREDLARRLARLGPGAALELAVQRDGQERTVRLVLAERPGLEELVRHQHLDRPAPELTGVVGVAGEAPPRLGELGGKVVLLEFYAGWCPNCRALSPVLARWHERYKARGLAVVGVTNDDPETAAQVIRDWRIPYPVGCAEADLPYAAVALPTLFLVDRKGVVREVMIGRSAGKVAALEKRLVQLLGEKG